MVYQWAGATASSQLDLGLWLAVGGAIRAIPPGEGFSLGLAVQVPILLLVRPSVTVAPALFLAYRTWR